MKVLVACEFSGVVRDAFAALGHDAVSCDLLPSETPGTHYQGDIFDILYEYEWDLMIAHPPCTYLSNSGVRWLYLPDGSRNEERWAAMREGAEFFKKLWEADIPAIAVENPVMHKYAREIIGASHTQTFQPHDFGHGECKRTCLWLKGLPKLKPTNKVNGREQRIWKMPPGPDRQKERSRTFPGVADAMASQWTEYLKGTEKETERWTTT